MLYLIKFAHQISPGVIHIEGFYDHFAEHVNSIGQSPVSHGQDKGMMRGAFSENLHSALRDWYRDPRLGNSVVNHESRGHISSDLHRYLYYSVYANVIGASPKSLTLPRILSSNDLR